MTNYGHPFLECLYYLGHWKEMLQWNPAINTINYQDILRIILLVNIEFPLFKCYPCPLGYTMWLTQLSQEKNKIMTKIKLKYVPWEASGTSTHRGGGYHNRASYPLSRTWCPPGDHQQDNTLMPSPGVSWVTLNIRNTQKRKIVDTAQTLYAKY